MLSAITPSATREYISTTDKDRKNTTVFILRCLTVEEDAWLEDTFQEYRTEKRNTMAYKNNVAQKTLAALHLGLVSVKNFPAEMQRDEAAPEVFGGTKPWKSDCLLKIPKYVRAEVAFAILSGSEIGEDERKN